MTELLLIVVLINIFAITGIIAYCFLIRKYSVFHPISLYSVAHFFSFVMPATGLLLLGNFSDQEAHKFIVSNVLMLIGLVMFMLAFNSGIGKILIPLLPSFTYSWKKSRLRIVIVVYTIVGIAGLTAAMGNMGGILIYALNIGNKTAFAAGEGPLLELFNFYNVASFMWFVSMLIRGIDIALSEKILFGLHLLLLTAFSLVLGGRAGVLNIFLGMLIAYDLYVKKIPYRPVLILAAVALVFVFVSGIYRENANNDDWMDQITTKKAGEFVAGGFNFANGGDVVGRIVEAVPDKIDIQWGNTYGALVYYMLPSKFVGDKPPTAPALINDLFADDGYDTPTMSPTMLGEAYLNFAILGIFVIPFLFGLFSSAVYTYVLQNKGRGGTIVIGVLAILFIWGFPITNFIDGAKTFLFRLIPALLCIWVIQKKQAHRVIVWEENGI